MDINISQYNHETIINGSSIGEYDVATLKEAMRIAKIAIKDIQKDLCRRYQRVNL